MSLDASNANAVLSHYVQLPKKNNSVSLATPKTTIQNEWVACGYCVFLLVYLFHLILFYAFINFSINSFIGCDFFLYSVANWIVYSMKLFSVAHFELTSNLRLELLNGQRTVHKTLKTLLSSALQIVVHLAVWRFILLAVSRAQFYTFQSDNTATEHLICYNHSLLGFLTIILTSISINNMDAIEMIIASFQFWLLLKQTTVKYQRKLQTSNIMITV